MLKTLAVTIAGLVLCLILLSVGTAFALRHTSWGSTPSDQSSESLWEGLPTAINVIRLRVILPTVVIVALLMGYLAKRFAVLAALVATAPASVVTSGFQFDGAPEAGAWLLCAGLVGYVSSWWKSKRAVKKGA